MSSLDNDGNTIAHLAAEDGHVSVFNNIIYRLHFIFIMVQYPYVYVGLLFCYTVIIEVSYVELFILHSQPFPRPIVSHCMRYSPRQTIMVKHLYI